MKRSLLLGAVLLMAGCFSAYDTPKPGEMRVRRGKFTSTMVLTGELEAARGAMVSVPQLPSWQSSIRWLIDDGVAVKAGERIAELDNTPFTADLDKKRQDLTQAQQELQEKAAEWVGDLRDKQFDVEKKKGDLDKAKIEAAVPKDIVSGRDYEDRQTKLRRATTDYDKSRATLAAQQKADNADRANLLVKIEHAQDEVTIAERSIDSLILRAPEAGIVVVKDIPWEARKLQAGDSVWVGFPIAVIPELDSMRVTAALPDVDDGRVLRGMPARVTLDGYPNMHFAGRVDAVSAVAQEGARGSLRRAFVVLVKLDQIDPQRMRPGLSARVEIDRESKSDVLVAPRAALDFSGKTPRARLSGGKFVNVDVGSCNAQECVVTSGLQEGARLGS
ncbi:MAG TPA: efflux RND transporter periplasmic adaptor subunit [Thermoanaerobaculia bacterium]|jgi:multidrug efflux pump subunit AcrA (membrane-fusion protein)|nr:efflux RND transporter periplasmic adaptor subunit [Thermoanaerobaculia bacterium]